MTEQQFVQYEVVDRVAVITLDRGDKANAQHRGLLDELHACWQSAATDPGVNVVLLQANGRHFSAGHDLTGGGAMTPEEAAEHRGDAVAYYNAEATYFFGYTMAWRNMPKPSIAAVQGKCVAAGMMLCWPCDLILAADNAEFSDPTTRMGLAGIEYMAHVWELGPRKAKEMLLRSTAITAHEAMALGMVNRVVPLDHLREEAMAWAVDIAGLDPAMAAVVKRSVNSALDTQGFSASLAHAFDLHELAHTFQASQRRSGEGGGPTNLLEHMRKANADIAQRQAADRTG